jgi:hypothetical protein|nr:MAG TPA: hypothetical protein [Caudoviricetes sp.]
MKKAKEMLLEDALSSAIHSEKRNIQLKKALTLSAVFNIVCLVYCALKKHG